MNPKKQTDDFSKLSILVIDDEARIRNVIHTSLSRDGFDVEVAENGEMGMQMINQRHFDIILLDLMMPGISGLNVLNHLKSHHPHSVVIVITGYATIEHSTQAIKNGAFDFIAKPFSPSDLRGVIAKASEFIRALKDITGETSRFRALINHISDGVMVTDARKKIVLANPAFLKTVDYFKNDAIGRPVDDVVSIKKIRDMIDETLSRHGEIGVYLTDEVTIGENVASARCIPFRDRLHRNLGAIIATHDITALKKMDRLKSDFVSMVAHEIRSPLNSINMQLQVIMEGLAGDVTEKQMSILNRAHEKITALGDFSSDLLDLARIESGLVVQDKENLDMGALIADQVIFLQETARAKKIRLSLEPSTQWPLVLANKQNMEEVFSNLISNAIKYTPDGGEIKIAATVGDVSLKITVSDNGFGISDEDMGRVFDKFFRVKNKMTRQITGSGLGLGIVKAIVEAHHGKVELKSELGKGSSFSVYIPIIEEV